jgi:hypothetical protein
MYFSPDAQEEGSFTFSSGDKRARLKDCSPIQDGAALNMVA